MILELKVALLWKSYSIGYKLVSIRELAVEYIQVERTGVNACSI